MAGWLERQIEFFREKLDIPTEQWDDLWEEQHNKAFVVAGAMQADLLADLHGAVQRAIEEGVTLEEFTADFERIVEKNGWTGWRGEGTEAGRAWRARVIYETNLRTSYAAGRYRYLTEHQDEMPFWRYKHNDSVMHPRPNHVALDDLVLPATDPFWSRSYPPGGFGCRCYVEGLSSQYMRVHRMEPDPVPTDFEPDPGWAYAPGASVQDEVAALIEEKARRLPEPLRRDFLSSLSDGITGLFGSVLGLVRRLLGGG